MMTRQFVVIMLYFAMTSASSSQAGTIPKPGPVSPGYAKAYYYTWTGEITFSVNVGISWDISSESHGLTGNAPMNLPLSDLPFVSTDNDRAIGESSFTYDPRIIGTDIELGAVAAPFLPEGDLTIGWNESIGEPYWFEPVVYIYIPEPSTLFLTCLAGVLFCSRRRRR